MDLLQVANTAYYQLGEYYGCFVRTVNVCSTLLSKKKRLFNSPAAVRLLFSISLQSSDQNPESVLMFCMHACINT